MAQTWSSLRKRAGDHWQVPALLLSGVLLVTAVLQLRPSPVSMPLDEAAQFLKAYVDGGVYGPAIKTGWELLRRENIHERRRERVRGVGARDVLIERAGVELREDEDPVDAGMKAVRDRHVDQSVLATDRHGWLCAVAREWIQSGAAPTAEDHAQYVEHSVVSVYRR